MYINPYTNYYYNNLCFNCNYLRNINNYLYDQQEYFDMLYSFPEQYLYSNYNRQFPTSIPTDFPTSIPTDFPPSISGLPKLPNWKNWKKLSEQSGGHWVEEGTHMWNQVVQGSKNVQESLGLIRKRFQPCIPPPNYSCVEYRVMSNLPIFGSTESEDIFVRICYPSHIKFNPKMVQDALSQWLHACLSKATDAAGKAFIGAIILTAWGAFVGSISAGISAATNAFRNNLITCLTTPPGHVTINHQQIIPSVYMRKSSPYIPQGNNCILLYEHY